MSPKKTSPDKKDKISIVRFIYLYIITAITFIVFIIGAITIVDVVLKAYVFDVDEYEWSRPPTIYCENLTRGPEYEDCLKRREAAEEKEDARIISKDSARRLSIGIAQVIVAFPLWIFHWRIIERDRKRRRK